MTRSSPHSLYDEDFFAWTQDQAAALRRTRSNVDGNDIDVAHVAEEIEDLGKRELREVLSYLELFFEHLIKIDSCPSSLSLKHWRSEARHFRRSAQATYSPGMRQLIDLTSVWAKGIEAAREDLSDDFIAVTVPLICPFKLDELLGQTFDIDRGVERLRSE